MLTVFFFYSCSSAQEGEQTKTENAPITILTNGKIALGKSLTSWARQSYQV